jgi:5-methylcytosine-specific restriction endonuclease McrA
VEQYGYGSIYQRKVDGRWFARIELPRERDEPRRGKTFSRATREAVIKLLDEYREANPPTEYVGRAAYMENARRQGTHTPKEWHALARSVKCVCAYCGVKTGLYNMEKDHIIPVSRGGSDAIENIAVSCTECNAEKKQMTGDEYRAWKARTK